MQSNIMPSTGDDFVQEVEITLMLEGLYRISGFDFRNYSKSMLQRRIKQFCIIENVGSVSALQERIFHDPVRLTAFAEFMTVTRRSMFKDPKFYLALREHVVPLLAELPLVRIWQVGCSTGHEAYSLAIMLDEEGVYDRCRIYATDPDLMALQNARSGMLPLSAMRQYTENYIQAGGLKGFSAYYTANFDNAILNSSIKRNIVFGQHDFSHDTAFNEFHMVLLRDVLIHIDDSTRQRLLSLVHESLTNPGVLALGKWETLSSSPIENQYRELDSTQKLYVRQAAG